MNAKPVDILHDEEEKNHSGCKHLKIIFITGNGHAVVIFYAFFLKRSPI